MSRLFLAFVLLGACGPVDRFVADRPSGLDPRPYDCAGDPPPPEALTWKRVEPFLTDLAVALEVPRDALCRELDVVDCGTLHRVSLGGHDPLRASQYRPIAAPLATTPAAVDRVVLGACTSGVTAGAAFTALPPDDVLLTADDPRIDQQVDALYRRLLHRDAETEERALVAGLADGRTAREFDRLACFAIATTTEGVFF